MRRKRSRKKKLLRNHSIFDQELKRWKTVTQFSSDEYICSPRYQSKEILEALLFASMTKTSINSACSILRNQNRQCPSEETILRSIHKFDAETMEIYLNQILRNQYQNIPSKIRGVLQRKGILVIDFHTDPYYGSKTTPLTTVSQHKASTNRFFSYLTADIIHSRFGQTIAVHHRRGKTAVATMIGDLLAAIEQVFQPKLIIMDGEFSTIETCLLLEKKGIQFVARKGIRKNLQKYFTSDPIEQSPIFNSFQPVIYRKKDTNLSITLLTTVYYVHGKLKALSIPANSYLSVTEAIKLYSQRFKIETGYRDKHHFVAPTCSRQGSVRLILFVFSCILWNIWQLFRKKTTKSPHSMKPRKYRWKYCIDVIRVLWIGQELERRLNRQNLGVQM